MKIGGMNKEIFKLSMPLLLSLVAQNVINITDTAFLGRLGEVELGASAIGGLTYVAFYMLAVGFCTGTQAQIGKSNGEKNYREIGSIFTHGIVILSVLAAVLILFTEIVMPPIFRNVMQSEQVADASVRFLMVRMGGLFFVYGLTLFRTLYIGILETKILIVNAVFMALVNVVLDYCLIFGHWGFPAMGIEGAALASVIAEGASLFFLVGWTFLKLDWKKYDLRFRRKYSWSKVREIMSISLYTMLQSFISLSTWLIFFVAVERIGERPLAISNILRSLYMLLAMPSQALATTAGTMISNAIGREEQHNVLKILNYTMGWGLVFSFIAFLVTLAFPEFLIKVYTDSPELIDEGARSLWVIGISIALFTIGIVSLNGMFGAAKTKSSFLIEMVALVVYVAYVMTFVWWLQSSVSVCWMSEWVYWGVTFVCSYAMLLYYRKHQLFR